MTPSDPRNEKARREILKGIIRDLHAGAEPGTLRARFRELVKDVDASEIAKMEQELVAEGLPLEEIQRLCDVHVELVKEGLPKKAASDFDPGHPLHAYQASNQALAEAAERFQSLVASIGCPPDAALFTAAKSEIAQSLATLAAVERHYLRKENQLFPFLERHGITAPPQVMWAVHDDVRAMLKRVGVAVADDDLATLHADGLKLASMILDMIYKEENILFPTALRTLDADEWSAVRSGEGELERARGSHATGIAPPSARPSAPDPRPARASSGVPLDTGALTGEQVNLLLTHLPVDVTFVDENDEVRYYSATRDRIFPRSPAIIGRKVQNCHPPGSVHIVNRIVEALRNGTRDVAEFWLELGGKLIHIRYFAVRDKDGRYRGTIEVSQDISSLRKLEGERRLLNWD
jgi:DUF438 domain-containing protein